MTIRVRYAMLFCFLLFPFLVSELEAQTRIRREIENSPAAVEGPEHSRRPTRRPPDAPDWVPAPHIGSFSLDQSQLGVTVARGQSVSITIRVVPSGGFTDPVQITSPSGIGGGSVSIEPGIVNSPYDQVVTLTASTTEATTLGMQWVEIRGSGGGVVVDQGIYVDVVEPGAGTFEIYLSREIVDVVQGSSGSLTVSTSKSGDFSAPIEYTISGLPEGLSVDALPHVAEPPVYAPFGVEFSAASSLAPGTYEAMITGTGGGQSASHPVSIRVTAPAAGDYTVAVTPNPVRFASHPARETFSFTIASVGGFAGAVEVSMVSNGEVVALAKDCAPGSFCPFVPTTFTLAAGGTASDQAIASTTGPVGGTIYLVTRTPGLDEKHTEVPVQPGLATPDFALAVTPAILTLPQGATSEVMLTLVRSGGFSDAVTVSASPSTGLQAPASLSFAPGETTKTVAITADMNAPAGAGHVLFNGTAPGVAGTRTARVDLMVTQTAQPDFTVALNPAAMTLTQGAAGTTVLNVQRTNGFAGPIDVMIAVPPGITADMTAFTIPAGETSRSVTLSAAPDAITGPQPVTFTAAAPEIGRTLTATLQLTVSQAAEPPDFTLAVTPAVMTLESGSAKTITLTLTRQNFAGAVHVAAVATPAGVNVPAVVFAPNETTRDV